MSHNNAFGATVEPKEELGWVAPDLQFSYTPVMPSMCFIQCCILQSIPLKGLTYKNIWETFYETKLTCVNGHQKESNRLFSGNLQVRKEPGKACPQCALPGVVCSCH